MNKEKLFYKAMYIYDGNKCCICNGFYKWMLGVQTPHDEHLFICKKCFVKGD